MGWPARKPSMSRADPGNEIQLETTASTTMNASISQVRFRNRRSPKQRGTCVPSHAGRHNPTRIRDGGEYRFREGAEPTERARFTPVAMVLRRTTIGPRRDEANTSACRTRWSTEMPFALRLFFDRMSKVQAMVNPAPWTTGVVEGTFTTGLTDHWRRR